MNVNRQYQKYIHINEQKLKQVDQFRYLEFLTTQDNTQKKNL